MRGNRLGGFTLIELVVVFAVLLLLASFLLPTLTQAGARALQTYCLSNQRQLGVGFLCYPASNNGQLVSAWPDSSQGWINTRYLGMVATETDYNITSGKLYPYIGSTNVYHCPKHPGTSATPPYWIAYTMSHYINGERGQHWGIRSAVRATDIRLPRRSMVLLEATDQDYNVNGYVDIRGHNVNSWVNSSAWSGATDGYGGSAYNWRSGWVDWAGAWHLGGNIHLFADGHAYYYPMKDPFTATIHWACTGPPDGANNPDLQYFQSIYYDEGF